jgi:hypothetical protein
MNTLIKQEAERRYPDNLRYGTVKSELDIKRDAFLAGASYSYAQSLRPGWVKASDRLPGLHVSVEWRNREGGDIPLGKMTIIEKWEKSPNTSWHEWLDEGGSDGWISVESGLPEFGLYNVCYYNPSDENKSLYVIPLWMGRGRWCYDNSDREPAEGSTLKVTHFMPLPSPPKQQTK